MELYDDVNCTLSGAHHCSWRFPLPYLKLHRDEIESHPPEPLPFSGIDSSWRSAGHHADDDSQGDTMDSIARVEEALSRVESTFESLSEQVDEVCESFRMSDWLATEDDGPYAA